MSADAPTKPPRPIPGVPVRRLPQGGLGGAVPRLPPLPGDLVAGLTEARPGADSEPRTASSPAGPVSTGGGFELKIRKPIETVKALGILVAIVLGALNQVEKATEAKVTRVADKAETAHRTIEGDSQAADRDAKIGLSGRLDALEWSRAQDRIRGCQRDRWLAEILRRQTPPVFVTVEGCADVPVESFEAKEGPSMPGGRRTQTVVITPMP
jgi:hypothetical protein